MNWKKMVWSLSLLVLAGITYLVIAGLDTQLDEFKIIDRENVFDDVFDETDLDEEEYTSETLPALVEEGRWESDNAEAFFVEYRMQRDRVRDQEIELLTEVVESDEASESSRTEAEETIMNVVDLMEKELLVENLLKGKGFEDALFFYRDDVATVIIKAEELDDVKLAQVADIVAGKVGARRESVQILTRN